MATLVDTTNIDTSNEQIDKPNDTTDSADTDIVDSDSIQKSNFDPTTPHKLYRQWSLYYTPPVQSSSKSLDSDSWANLLKKFITIDTVELYWQIMNNIKAPTQLTTGTAYHMFVDGIKPEWEDSANRDGGKWTILIKRTDNITVADTQWSTLTMCCIGEWLEYSEYINGVVVQPRAREIRLQIWTRSGDNESIQLSIGRKLKELLKVNDRIEYTLHHSKSRSADYIL